MSAWERMLEITSTVGFTLCQCQRGRDDVRGGRCKTAPGLRHPDSLGDLLSAVAMGTPVLDHTNDAIFYVSTDIGDRERWNWDDGKDTTAEEVIHLQRVTIATKYAGLNTDTMRDAIAGGFIPSPYQLQNHLTYEWPRFRILTSYQPVEDITTEELEEVARRIKGE